MKLIIADKHMVALLTDITDHLEYYIAREYIHRDKYPQHHIDYTSEMKDVLELRKILEDMREINQRKDP